MRRIRSSVLFGAVVAEDGPGGGDIGGEHAFDAFAQKFFAELGIEREAGADRLFEIAGQCGHGVHFDFGVARCRSAASAWRATTRLIVVALTSS
jgi:hypothetical protein